MINLISIILIIILSVFLLIYKRKYIFKIFNNEKIITKNGTYIMEINKFNRSKFLNKYSHFKYNNIYTNSQKAILRKEMLELFKGTKNQKIQALNIAKDLSDKSTLKLLRIGLKDMDSDVVKLSANLIEKFKKY